ncbi:MAG TPA: ATP-binding protein [Candidatus Eisenbacteria bacterium]|nr:ATP-binding protein [Candidatus Eisenbacteria bacterium]
MRSLRARWIAGSALVAVVPLAVAIALLSQRVGSLVREQAAGRLGASLAGLSIRLAQDQERTAEKLEILSRDPTLRRIVLVHGLGASELGSFLGERCVLLSLDFLEVADSTGRSFHDTADDAVPPPAAVALTEEAPILYENREVARLRGGVRLDERALMALKSAGGVDLVLLDRAGSVVAATMPPARAALVAHASSTPRSILARRIPIETGSPSRATIVGVVATDEIDRTIATFQLAAALLGLLGLGVAVALGMALSAQLSRPVDELAAFARKVARGEWSDPLTLRSVRELETLVSALETMRGDLAAYRERLVTSERQAAWSLMARKVAHEVKNPLTPIAVSVADLKRSYEQQRPDFPAVLDQAVRTISEEVAALKRLLQEFSDFARLPAPRLAPCAVGTLLADVGALYGPDVARGRLRVVPPPGAIAMLADAEQMRQVLINLIQNAFDAMGSAGAVTLSAGTVAGSIELTVADEGPGLTEEERAQLFVPGFTTKAQGSGLGLTIAQRIVHDHGGSIAIDSTRGRGTTIRVRVPLAEEA